MNATTTLTQLKNSGVTITLTGDSLRWRGPSGAMTTALRAALVANKAEVRRLLALDNPPAEPVTLDTLPPTTAGLNRALTILEAATGCPDGEADALLGQWDSLVRRYTDSLAVDPLPIRTGDQAYQQVALL